MSEMMTTSDKTFRRHAASASLLLCVSAVWMQGCKKPAAEVEKPVVTVQAAHPEVGEIAVEIEADAVLAPIAQAALLPKVTAPVKKFYVQRGAHVKAGQLLATLENSDLAAAAVDNGGSYDAAKGAYAAATQQAVPEEQNRARLEVNQAKATLDLAVNVAKSRKELVAQGAIPGRDYDTARTAVVQAQAAYDLAQQKYDVLLKVGTSASLETAKGQLASAKGKYLGAEAQLSYTNIRTPISGVVTDRTLFAGETAAAGMALITVMDTSTMLAKLHIAQRLAQQLTVGAPAELMVAGIDEPLEAKVSLVSPATDPGSTTIEVWLKTPNPGGRLHAGTAVHVTLKGRAVANALLIPTEAVQRSAEGAGKTVLVIAADGTSKKRSVAIGIQTKEKTQIVSGLKPDDTVIVSGGYGLDEGTKVKVGPAEGKDAADAGAASDGAAPEAAAPDAAAQGDTKAKGAAGAKGDSKAGAQ